MIEISPFNSVLTISFLNKSHEPRTPVVWVCVNRAAYDKALEKLAGQDWIEVVQHGNAHVEGL